MVAAEEGRRQKRPPQPGCRDDVAGKLSRQIPDPNGDDFFIHYRVLQNERARMFTTADAMSIKGFDIQYVDI